jgi:hypothetical protein
MKERIEGNDIGVNKGGVSEVMSLGWILCGGFSLYMYDTTNILFLL